MDAEKEERVETQQPRLNSHTEKSTKSHHGGTDDEPAATENVKIGNNNIVCFVRWMRSQRRLEELAKEEEKRRVRERATTGTVKVASEVKQKKRTLRANKKTDGFEKKQESMSKVEKNWLEEATAKLRFDHETEVLTEEYLAHHSGTAYRYKNETMNYHYIWLVDFICWLWELVVFGIIVAISFFAVYLSAFSFGNDNVEATLFSITCVYGVDVILRLWIEIFRYLYEIPYVFFKVQYTFTQLVLDLLVLFPFVRIASVVLGLIEDDSLFRLGFLSSLYLIQLCVVYRGEKYMIKVVHDSTFNEKGALILKMLFYYLLIMEIYSAAFFMHCGTSYISWILYNESNHVDNINLSCYLTFRRKRAMFQRMLEDFEVANSSQLFLFTMDFVMSIFTTSGKLATFPLTDLEFFLVILAIFTAICANGVIASKFLEHRLDRDLGSFELFYRLRVDEARYNGRCPKVIANLIYNFGFNLWVFREGFQGAALSSLPFYLHEMIMLSICSEMFHKSILFCEVNTHVLASLARRVRIQLYNPGMILCTDGERCENMYYLIGGEVNVRSKTNIQHVAAVLRAGTIIGEFNMLFTIPYEMQIETKTVCQMLVLERDVLYDFLNVFPQLRNELKLKFDGLTKGLLLDYFYIGAYPLQFAIRRVDRSEIETPRFIMQRNAAICRVTKDVVDDTGDVYIISMPSYDFSTSKDFSLPYQSFLLPAGLILSKKWARGYNVVLFIFVLILGVILPACAAFHQEQSTWDFDATVCDCLIYIHLCDFVIPLAVVIMFLMEAYISSISTGIWYSIRDGLSIRLYSIDFYLDVLCVCAVLTPWPLYGLHYISFRNPFAIVAAVAIIQYIKVWRYFSLMNLLHPLNMLLIRCLKMIITLIYFVHFIACFMNWLTINERDHWMDSYARASERAEFSSPIIKIAAPYLYPVSFAVSIISLNGFTEFMAQTHNEMRIVFIIEIFVFFLLVWMIAELASGIICRLLPKVRTYYRLQEIRAYLESYYVKKNLADRIDEHFTLQLHHSKAVELVGEHDIIYDFPYYLTDAVIESEYRVFLEGVPLFSHADDEVFRRVSRGIRSYVLPPGIKFMHNGELRHEMYIIVDGYVGMFKHRKLEEEDELDTVKTENPEGDKTKDKETNKTAENEVDGQPENKTNETKRNSKEDSVTTNEEKRGDTFEHSDNEKYISLLGPTAHFGIRDLLFSEPCKYDVRTMSYVQLFVIDKKCLEESLSADETAVLANIIKKESTELEASVDEVKKDVEVPRFLVPRSGIEHPLEKVSRIPSWIIFPAKKGSSYTDLTDEEYESIRKQRDGCFFMCFMMGRVVHPSGYFAKCWTLAAGLATMGIFLTLFIELFMGCRTPTLRMIGICLDFISWMDIYIKLHWAYYSLEKNLVTHPAETARRYIREGMFFFDICFVIPLELAIGIIEVLFRSNGMQENFIFGYAESATWYSKLRWDEESYQTIFYVFSILLYTISAISFAIICGCIASFFSCPWWYKKWAIGDQYRLPFCWATWTRLTYGYAFYPAVRRLVICVYYAVQMLFCVGYGEFVVLDAYQELVLIIVMSLIGVISLVYVVSDIVAAQFDTDEFRTQLAEQKKRILHLLKKAEKLKSSDWPNVVSDHFNYTWRKSRGYQTTQISSKLHPVLGAELFEHFAANLVDRIPLFQNMNEPATRYMCNLFQKVSYLQGYQISRVGNLQFEFCLIIRGSSYVCNSSMQWLCTLRAGEFFGESDILFELPRKHGIVAATNIELLILNLESFNKLKKCYPNVKQDILKMMKNSLNDVHESKIRHETEHDEEYKKLVKKTTQELRELLLTNPQSLEGITRRRKKSSSRHCCLGCGVQDRNLPFLYFASECKVLFHPNCQFMRLFYHLCDFANFFYPCLALYLIVFVFLGPPPIDAQDVATGHSIMMFCFIFQIVLIVDMVLRLFTPFELYEPETYCKVWCKIILNYLTDPGLFMLDLISVPPWWRIHPALVGLLFCRLFRFYGWMRRKKEDLDFSVFEHRLFVYGSFFALLGHVVACLFFHMAFLTTNVTWINVYNLKYIDAYDLKSSYSVSWYMRSLYFSISTMTRIGFGDIVPITLNNYILVVCAIVIGGFLVALFIANVAFGLTSIAKAERVFFYNALLLTNHLKTLGLSRAVESYTRTYFTSLWDECRGISIHECLAILPKAMQIDLATVLFAPTLMKCQMFATIGELTFIRNVCSAFEHATFLPGQLIVKEGDPGEKLYLVHSGEVAAYEAEDTDTPAFFKRYVRGDAFGKTAVFYKRTPYSRSYRAETLVHVLFLSQESILFIAKYYPRWQFYVENFIHARHEHILFDPEHVHIFMDSPSSPSSSQKP